MTRIVSNITQFFILILCVLTCLPPYNFLGLKIDEVENIWTTNREEDDEGNWNCTGNSTDNFGCVDLGQSHRRSVPIFFTEITEGNQTRGNLIMNHNNKHRRGEYNRTTGIITWTIFDPNDNSTPTGEEKLWTKGMSLC